MAQGKEGAQMKILTLSDVVVDLVQSPMIAQRFKDIDLVLSAGDLPLDYLDYVVTMLGKRLYYVNGNHVQQETREGERFMQTVEPEGCINIHHRLVNHRGLLIGGLEGSMRYSKGNHQYTQFEMSLLAKTMAPCLWWNTIRYGRAIDVLVTHAPPQGIHDGQDLCHRGFRAFLRFMERYRPRYLIHGHTHLYRQDARRITQYRDTTVINTYGFQVIEIDEMTLTQPRRKSRKEEGNSGATKAGTFVV